MRLESCALFICLVCVLNSLPAQVSPSNLSVSIEPGKEWVSTMWIAFIPKKKIPQFAVWLENTDAAVSLDSPAGNLLPGTEYVVQLEVNTSYDYNESWPKNLKPGRADYLGVNGQPSLIYEGRFIAGKTGTVELLPVGQGSVDGSNGQIKPGLEGLTTALQMIKTANVQIKGVLSE